ncbi:imidazole glycerol phosphate synthase subunit HisH [Spiribacter sp. 2438]|uniref:imidazole glycerol phosphate synthase subunit HisH n=1 Tax=Spiribacter sp. 2438 TaxID=2666185 RepID=UPI0012B04F2F|nr:imidazole glycerol phosphate synthase subunit HisH [Spiribacter sp. 2438]QGM20886.1 imidazole glycerol phosphate synthase subunit HisH [Spiribacter sp. 2438]
MTVAVIDYGMGNLRSVARALEHVGGREVRVTDDPAVIDAAQRVVFPGQGAVRDCMSALHRHELVDVIQRVIVDRPFLGICMGMQALMAHSEENDGVDALGHFVGTVRHFRALTQGESRLKIPHMGWNRVHQVAAHPLWAGVPQDERFYFVHSYYVLPDDDGIVQARSDYGGSFAAALGAGNVFATQFHPEKSQRPGLRLLENFLAWDGESCS